MCGIKEWFFDLDESFRESVKLGNNMKLIVMGKGSVRLKIEGRVQVIIGVYLIPELRNSLLSKYEIPLRLSNSNMRFPIQIYEISILQV